METIEITKNNLNEIKYEDVMFLSFAEPGAMGEPGGIEMLLKNMKVYHVNYCYNEEIKINDLFPIFPPLETFRCGMCRVTNLDDNWQWLDMGMGNYLLVRKEIMEKFLNAIYEENVLGEEITPGLIYQKWLDVANKILNNNDDTYVFLSIHYEDDEVPHRTYYYISNTDDIKENDRVLVNRNGYETIGTVEKIETFNEKETPFPVGKTKKIIQKVDENFELEDFYIEDELQNKIRFNLDGTKIYFGIENYRKGENNDDDWTNIILKVNNQYFNYYNNSELMTSAEVERLLKKLEELLENKLNEDENIGFYEPDLEFHLYPKLNLWDTGKYTYIKEGHEIQDIYVELSINLTDLNGVYTGQKYVLIFDREEIEVIVNYIKEIIK